MTKILALIAGIFLIGFPAWMLKEMSVPLPAVPEGRVCRLCSFGL